MKTPLRRGFFFLVLQGCTVLVGAGLPAITGAGGAIQRDACFAAVGYIDLPAHVSWP